ARRRPAACFRPRAWSARRWPRSRSESCWRAAWGSAPSRCSSPARWRSWRPCAAWRATAIARAERRRLYARTELPADSTALGLLSHARLPSPSAYPVQPDLFVNLAAFGPALVHLDVEEQVHGHAEHFGQLLARGF